MQTWLALTNNGSQYGTKVHQRSPSWTLFFLRCALFASVFPRVYLPMLLVSCSFCWWQCINKADTHERVVIYESKNVLGYFSAWIKQTTNRHFMLFSYFLHIVGFLEVWKNDREQIYFKTHGIIPLWILRANLEHSVGSPVNSGHFKPVWKTAVLA